MDYKYNKALFAVSFELSISILMLRKYILLTVCSVVLSECLLYFVSVCVINLLSFSFPVFYYFINGAFVFKSIIKKCIYYYYYFWIINSIIKFVIGIHWRKWRNGEKFDLLGIN